MTRYLTPQDVTSGVCKIITDDSRHLLYALHGKQMVMTHTFNLKRLPARIPRDSLSKYVNRRKFVRLIWSACKGTVGRVRKVGNKITISVRGADVLGGQVDRWKLCQPFDRVRGDLHGT